MDENKKEKQVEAVITEITLNEKTYVNETFNPNLINFIYGKNGTGKSTISEYLQRPTSTYSTSIPRTDFELLVYNTDFIKNEIQSYGNISGLFTITKKNAEIKQEVDKLSEEVKEQKKFLQKNEADRSGTIAKRNQLSVGFLGSIWNQTADHRKLYPEALKGLGTKQSLLKSIKATDPVPHNWEEIQKLYDLSYGSSDEKYTEYEKVPVGIDVPESSLSTPIVNSGTTQFAKFLEELHASDWLNFGHSHFQHKAGDLCPYCQQKLPDDFEYKIASCFDKSYQDQIYLLKVTAERYKEVARGIIDVLDDNVKRNSNHYTTTEYQSLLTALESKFDKAFIIWDRKIQEPASVFELPDTRDELNRINACISKINMEIKKHNDIVDNRKKSQKHCSKMIMEQLAFECQGTIMKFQADEKNLLEKEKEISDEINKVDGEIKTKEAVIREKSKETVNTTEAMNNINRLIVDAGFQGFRVREKSGAKYVYELVRDDGSIVSNLSEGERNFIGFLYFYNIVMNSRSDDGIQRDKVVVIDDPVSSMDSSALFSVAALIRNLISICYNCYDLESTGPEFIKQFICLTHNPFFFKEISYNHISDYDCANYYELSKDGNNHSHIKLCQVRSGEVGNKYVNYSPIKNTYDALWAEYKTATEPIILMNVIRRILEYYFMQIVGYKGKDIRTEVLDKNREKFPNQWEYDTASAMIAYINTGAAGFDDGLYFDQSSVSASQLRSVFKNIFYVLKQDQHYDYMMR